MKKISRLLVLISFCVLGLILVGCGKSKVVEIVFNNNTEVSIDVFDFDSSDFTLIHEDGSKTIVKGSELEISDDDAGLLVEEGVHEVTLTYNKESFKTIIAISASAEDIIKPTGLCCVYSDSHYIDGVQYTSICVSGKDEGQFLAFEFKLLYDKTKVKNIKITPIGDYANNIEINDNGERISVNFVDNNPGSMNCEMFRIEYNSDSLYKNFTLDSNSEYGFYRFANKDIHSLNCSFNLNW